MRLLRPPSFQTTTTPARSLNAPLSNGVGACSHVPVNNGTACDLDNNKCTPDTCQAGVCTAGTPVACPPVTDAQCQTRGTWNSATGTCSGTVNAPNGTTCALDDNKCTIDTCQAGVCKHTSDVTCDAPTDTQCQVAGTCNPNTGVRSAKMTNRNDGTTCALDDNKCTIDTCQAGVCKHTSDVTCDAPTDTQCQVAGTCNPNTGVCSATTNRNDGTTCELDDNKCTIDTCQAGVCKHTSDVTCDAPTDTQCQVAGTCNPNTGVCSPTTNRNDGTTCELDDNKCTIDTCQAGVCKHTSDVTCDAPTDTQCQVAGTCNPNTGVCSATTNRNDGTTCELDDNKCTIDTCQAGVCKHTSDVTCDAPTDTQCQVAGTCNPNTGVCSATTNRNDGTTCALDDNKCTIDTCQAGVCKHTSDVTCDAPTDTQCQVAGTCNPNTGVCSATTNRNDGTTCALDDNKCTIDTCQAGVCKHTSDVTCDAPTDTQCQIRAPVIRNGHLLGDDQSARWHGVRARQRCLHDRHLRGGRLQANGYEPGLLQGVLHAGLLPPEPVREIPVRVGPGIACPGLPVFGRSQLHHWGRSQVPRFWQWGDQHDLRHTAGAAGSGAAEPEDIQLHHDPRQPSGTGWCHGNLRRDDRAARRCELARSGLLSYRRELRGRSRPVQDGAHLHAARLRPAVSGRAVRLRCSSGVSGPTRWTG